MKQDVRRISNKTRNELIFPDTPAQIKSLLSGSSGRVQGPGSEILRRVDTSVPMPKLDDNWLDINDLPDTPIRPDFGVKKLNFTESIISMKQFLSSQKPGELGLDERAEFIQILDDLESNLVSKERETCVVRRKNEELTKTIAQLQKDLERKTREAAGLRSRVDEFYQNTKLQREKDRDVLRQAARENEILKERIDDTASKHKSEVDILRAKFGVLQTKCANFRNDCLSVDEVKLKCGKKFAEMNKDIENLRLEVKRKQSLLDNHQREEVSSMEQLRAEAMKTQQKLEVSRSEEMKENASRISSLEMELKQKSEEISKLKSGLANAANTSREICETDVDLRKQIRQKDDEICKLRSDSEKYRSKGKQYLRVKVDNDALFKQNVFMRERLGLSAAIRAPHSPIHSPKFRPFVSPTVRAGPRADDGRLIPKSSSTDHQHCEEGSEIARVTVDDTPKETADHASLKESQLLNNKLMSMLKTLLETLNMRKNKKSNSFPHSETPSSKSTMSSPNQKSTSTQVSERRYISDHFESNEDRIRQTLDDLNNSNNSYITDSLASNLDQMNIASTRPITSADVSIQTSRSAPTPRTKSTPDLPRASDSATQTSRRLANGCLVDNRRRLRRRSSLEANAQATDKRLNEQLGYGSAPERKASPRSVISPHLSATQTQTNNRRLSAHNRTPTFSHRTPSPSQSKQRLTSQPRAKEPVERPLRLCQARVCAHPHSNLVPVRAFEKVIPSERVEEGNRCKQHVASNLSTKRNKSQSPSHHSGDVDQVWHGSLRNNNCKK
eukprot:890251_1